MSFHPNSALPTGALPPARGWPLPFRRLWLTAVLASILVAGGATWLNAQRGGPTISWSQGDILEFLQPNESREITVRFRSSQTLENVSVWVNPGLAPLVTTKPTTFSKINANQEQQLTLQLRAGSNSQVKIEGTIHLRPTGTTRTIARPLPVTVIVHNQRVPPDPGEAGKLTLEGIDSDSDGLRDDLQRYIIVQYLDKPSAQKALVQMALAYQSMVLAPPTRAAAVAASAEESAASACLEHVSGLDSSIRQGDELLAEVLNTELRSRAYIRTDSLLSGQVSTLRDRQRLADYCRQ